MGIHTTRLERLAKELLSSTQWLHIQQILPRSLTAVGVDQDVNESMDLEAFLNFDDALPGPSLRRVDAVLYNIADRDVFRPFQYILAYYKMSTRATGDWGSLAWQSRDIVEMASLHLESLGIGLFHVVGFVAD